MTEEQLDLFPTRPARVLKRLLRRNPIGDWHFARHDREIRAGERMGSAKERDRAMFDAERRVEVIRSPLL